MKESSKLLIIPQILIKIFKTQQTLREIYRENFR